MRRHFPPFFSWLIAHPNFSYLPVFPPLQKNCWSKLLQIAPDLFLHFLFISSSQRSAAFQPGRISLFRFCPDTTVCPNHAIHFVSHVLTKFLTVVCLPFKQFSLSTFFPPSCLPYSCVPLPFFCPTAIFRTIKPNSNCLSYVDGLISIPPPTSVPRLPPPYL